MRSAAMRSAAMRYKATGANVTARLLLLAHITFYDDPYKRTDQVLERELLGKREWRRASVDKTSASWRERVYTGVWGQIAEMSCCFPPEFLWIDVHVHCNHNNTYVERLKRLHLPRVRVRVHVAPKEISPFALAWQHRGLMAKQLRSNSYDWVMYTEDDTFVPGIALRTQLDFAALASRHGALLSFVRVATDQSGRLFLADSRTEVRNGPPVTRSGRI